MNHNISRYTTHALYIGIIATVLLFLVLDSRQPETTQETALSTNRESREVLTSTFWVGEAAGADNGYISNSPSAWVQNWVDQFGGIDDPNDRCGYKPCGFEPKENPFYFALPYNDVDRDGHRKESADRIPWFGEVRDQRSVVKNQWIVISHDDVSCYAQWEDVGPFEEDDFDYVFGDSPPKNSQGIGAGLDISPATRDCLGHEGNSFTRWEFVNESEVPDGPWKEIISRSDASN